MQAVRACLVEKARNEAIADGCERNQHDESENFFHWELSAVPASAIVGILRLRLSGNNLLVGEQVEEHEDASA